MMTAEESRKENIRLNIERLLSRDPENERTLDELDQLIHTMNLSYDTKQMIITTDNRLHHKLTSDVRKLLELHGYKLEEIYERTDAYSSDYIGLKISW